MKKTTPSKYLFDPATLADETSDAYSARTYGAAWPACARLLAQRGYNHEQARAILRSKWMRWAEDNNRFGLRPTSATLARYLDHRQLTPQSTELVRDLGCHWPNLYRHCATAQAAPLPPKYRYWFALGRVPDMDDMAKTYATPMTRAEALAQFEKDVYAAIGLPGVTPALVKLRHGETLYVECLVWSNSPIHQTD